MAKAIPFIVAAVALIHVTVQAEVPQFSPEELASESSHIVTGTVSAVYSMTEKSKKWEDIRSVAEIQVARVEKGEGIRQGDVVYAHYWNKKWIGEGDAEPHSGGHGGVSKGDRIRAHLKRKGGAFHVLLPNGFIAVKPAEAKLDSNDRDKADGALAAVQGTWERTVESDRGTFRIVKEHRGHKTTVTVMDTDGRVLEAKQSEFRLEATGSVRVFTFFNNLFTAGPNKGRREEAPNSYIYRVAGDTFVEVRGMLLGDDDRLSAFTWKRVNQ